MLLHLHRLVCVTVAIFSGQAVERTALGAQLHAVFSSILLSWLVSACLSTCAMSLSGFAGEVDVQDEHRHL